MLQIYYIVRLNAILYYSVALLSIKRAQLLTRLRIIEIKNYAKRNSIVFIIRDYTIIKLIRLKSCCYAVYLLNIEERTTRIVRGLENSASASLLIYSIVLYNAIKEYYDNRTRKIIYFYSYTIENKCRTSYSNKKDIEANKREDKFAILVEKYIIDNCIIHALALTKDK
ncbi:hypothetical protein HBH53_247010 [Parastagonospora nodorum]|nr:hypothetical protein HBH53_247010 [Parastagonospora nodorum]